MTKSQPNNPTRRHMSKKARQVGAQATVQMVWVMGENRAVERPVVAAGAPPKKAKVTAKIPQEPAERPAAPPKAGPVPLAELDLAAKLALAIEELHFSTRVYNSLRRRGLDTVGHLAQKTADELYERRVFGEGSIDEVRAKLKAIGLTLAGEELPPSEA
jgi:DNA-directed RNA polymerase alpha subunit